MRNRIMIATAAPLLASATFAWAQQMPLPQQEQQSGHVVSATTTGGSIEFGGRLTSTTGDEARYERYRDLRSGANVKVAYAKATPDYIFNATVENAGYRDQRYNAGFSSRRIKFAFFFDQLPLNYSYDVRTPYVCQPGSCTLDAALRARVQAGGYGLGTPQTPAALRGGWIYSPILSQSPLTSRRDTVAGSVTISATDNLDLTVNAHSYKRTGNQPWGASYAFNFANEVPLTIDNRTTDVSAGIEWASHQGMMRLAYDYSKFDQNIPSFTWDNPIRATDYDQTRTTVVGYDPSGYVIGNGPARGRLAEAPSNTLTTFNWLGMVKLPNRTTANATFAMGAGRQNAELIPWTINPVLQQPALFTVFPGLAHLPRDTGQMKVNYTTGTVNFNSRPSQYVTVSARYRFNDRSDLHQPFNGEEYVRLDTGPQQTGSETEHFQINRNALDANVAFTPFRYGSIRVGYGLDRWEHTARTTDGWKTHTGRVSFDTPANDYITVRALFERSKRKAIGFDQEALNKTGMQPTGRFFDEASRIRKRAALIVDLNPVPIVGLNLAVSAGKDDYQGADPVLQFGLLNNTNTSYTVGLSVTPTPKLGIGGEYGREKYSALQQSRNANPAPDPSFADPTRNWTLTNDETVNTVSLFVHLANAVAKTNIRLGYDYSDSDQAFLFGGPRIPQLTALGQFIPLPDLTNQWQRGTVDFRYDVTSQVGLGFEYWFEKLDIADFATINSSGPASMPIAALGPQTNTPRNDWLGVVLTGYGNRPYKGQTGFIRLIYSF